MKQDSPEAEPRRTIAETTVLVVDDDPGNREIACLFLQDLGLAVELAADGDEVLAVLDRTPVALILMDLQMPRLGGLEAARAIRQRSHFRSIPIIAFTGDDRETTRQACLDAGLDDFMTKPVELAAFAAIIKKWLNPPSRACVGRSG